MLEVLYFLHVYNSNLLYSNFFHKFIFSLQVQATVARSQISRCKDILWEGVICSLKNFQIGQNQGTMLATKHTYRLSIHKYTTIKPCPKVPIPMYGFEFTTFEEISSCPHIETCLVGKNLFFSQFMLFQLYFKMKVFNWWLDIIAEAFPKGAIEEITKKNEERAWRMSIEFVDLKWVII